MRLPLCAWKTTLESLGFSVQLAAVLFPDIWNRGQGDFYVYVAAISD